MSTVPQGRALRWLYNRGGSGIFDKHGRLMARGELAGVMRLTWNSLLEDKLVEHDAKAKRLTITETGEQYCRSRPGLVEAECVADDEDA